MEVTSTIEGHAGRVVVNGDVDSETSPQLESAIAALLTGGVTELVVDVGAVSFLSSAGLSVLIGAQRDADVFRLERGNRIVDRLVSLTGLSILYGEEDARPAS